MSVDGNTRESGEVDEGPTKPEPERRDVFQACEDADRDVKAGPHAWIQWKGTEVCMDVHCSCGHHGHVDADFAYYVRCPACGRLWAMCANVRMIEVTQQEIEGRCPPVEAP